MVNRSMLIAIGLVLIVATSGFAWDESFRNRASGGLLEGDFDNDLDPIYIFDVESYRMYTTMSNLSSGRDEFFDNSSDGVYLFGTSGTFNLPPIGKWESRSMILIQLADWRNDLSLGLDRDWDGFTDTTGTGLLTGEWNDYNGWNTDSNYFSGREFVGTSATHYQIDRRRDWHLTHSYTDGSKIFGISFTHQSFGAGSGHSETNYSSNRWQFDGFGGVFFNPTHDYEYSYQRNRFDFDTTGAPLVYTATESGTYLTKVKNPRNTFELSYEMPVSWFGGSRFRVDLTFDKLSYDKTINDFYSWYEDDRTFYGNTEYDWASERFMFDSTASGSVISPGVQLTKDWNPWTYSWFRLGVQTGSYDADWSASNMGIRDWDSENGGVGVNTDIIQERRQAYNYAMDVTGDVKRSGYEFYHKTVTEFTKNFTFAAGLEWQVTKDKADDMAFTETETWLRTHDDGDGAPDASDWEHNYSLVGSGMQTSEITTKRKVFPVAMEYTLKRWTFRLAAVHSITSVTSETTTTYNGPQLVHDSTHYGDGTDVVNHSDSERPTSFTADREYKFFSNDFIYGLGFAANDNLDVEMMYFLGSGEDFIDSDFYSGLELSFTIKF